MHSLTRARNSVWAHTTLFWALFGSLVSLIRLEYFFLIFVLSQDQVMISKPIAKGKGKNFSKSRKWSSKMPIFSWSREYRARVKWEHWELKAKNRNWENFCWTDLQSRHMYTLGVFLPIYNYRRPMFFRIHHRLYHNVRQLNFFLYCLVRLEPS